DRQPGHAAMKVLAIRSLALLLPLLGTAAAWLWRPPTRRAAGAVYLATLWALPSLVLIHLMAARFGWWTFRFEGGGLFGMPADLLLGWALLWGAIPALLLPRAPLAATAALMIAIDLALMPLCAPVLILGPQWLQGELAATAIVLVPAQFLARWTARDEHLASRAFLQVVLFCALILLFLPAVVMSVAGRAPGLPHLPWLVLQAAIVAAIIGLTAVQEFVERGGGTPFPFDPPKRLVRSGVYAYVRNPMQLATALLFLMMGDVWLALIGVMSVVYAAGLAAWDEGADLARFGPPAESYTRQVRAWLPSWRPYNEEPATIYFAEGCDACSRFAAMTRALRPRALHFVAAESHPTEVLKRVRYEAADGAKADGIAAVARALEHVHLGWALIGFAARLPIARPILQLIFDATGARSVILSRADGEGSPRKRREILRRLRGSE
ncbi:MAG TPA: isoprenylcysteine carboxylmethyltransferase family protein, partial [Thermoanaerobaculia bacterium]|nr:isoprenylcysteine carboxylmethyltransferase family protein [Thermoanaerobaculia bacterium]